MTQMNSARKDIVTDAMKTVAYTENVSLDTALTDVTEGIVSRGRASMTKWMMENRSENPLYTRYYENTYGNSPHF